MRSLTGLMVRLERSATDDRRLDSEIVAAFFGPEGCVLDPVEGLDGWDVQYAPDHAGEAACWREAADIPAITSSIGEACEFVLQVRPHGALQILAAALGQAAGQPVDRTPGRVARCILVELLRVAHDDSVGQAQAA